MDKVFLDANVLFSATYSETNELLQLWDQPDAALITSGYPAEEARRNLQEEAALTRLKTLLGRVSSHPEPFPGAKPPPGIHLPDKDVPIILAAIHHGATHLLTGDVLHFDELFGHTVRGVLTLRPATYLRRSRPTGFQD